MGVAAPSTSASRLTRLVPILDWSRRYDRRWLRGDLIAGVAVAAMIVPKNLGYAGIAGIPVENGLYAAAAGGDHLRDLLHVAAHLDRSELVARGRRRRRGPGDRLERHRGGAAGGGDRDRDRRPVPPGRDPQAGLARQLPVAGGRDRVPRRRRDRRRHRRAAQAHRDVVGWRERVAGARVVGPRPGRISARRRCSSGSSRSPSSSGSGSGCRRCPARSCSSSAACSRRSLFDLGARGVALVGTGAARPAGPAAAVARAGVAEPSRRSSSRPSRCC